MRLPLAARARLRTEALALVRIGGPLTLTAMANMSLAITDVVMMGWIGAMQLGAGAAISDLYSILFYLAAGVAAAGAPILAAMAASEDAHDLRRAFVEVLVATLLLGAFLVPAVWHGALALEALGIEAKVLPEAQRYAHWMAVTLLPMLVVRTCVAWFSATERTHVVLAGTLCAIVLNVLGNGMFMFGWFGAPAMGMPGAGVSSFLVAMLLASGLLVAVHRSAQWSAAPGGRPTLRGIVECWTTGVPIGVSSLAELGVFLGSTVLMVSFGAAAVAAHAVALRLSGLLYAFAIGVSQAVSVRVAHWHGAGNERRLRAAVGAGFIFAGVICLADVILLWLLAEPIVALFLGGEGAESAAFVLAVVLVRILAPTEGVGAVATIAMGALRGLRDTRVPMVYSLLGLWGLAVPLALYLGFAQGHGAAGIWTGLLAGAVALAVPCTLRAVRTFGPSSRRRPLAGPVYSSQR